MMNDIDLNFDWNGDRIRITGARLRSVKDAEKLIRVVTIMRDFFVAEGPTEIPAALSPDRVTVGSQEPLSPAPGEVVSRASPEVSPATAIDAGGSIPLADRDLGEMQVRVLPVAPSGDDKGGPTGMGRSDSGESLTAGEAAPNASPAPELQSAEATTGSDDVVAEVHVQGAEDADLVANEGGEDVAPPAKAEEDIAPSSAAPSTGMELVKFLHDHEPDLTIKEVAERLHMPRGSVRGFSSMLRIKWRDPRAATGEPSPAGEGVAIPASPGRVSDEQADGAALYAVVKETPDLPVDRVVLPFEQRPVKNPRALTLEPSKISKKTKFRLHDGNGNYLHWSCETMVRAPTDGAQPKDTWEGTEAQLHAVRQKYPLAKDLAERIVGK